MLLFHLGKASNLSGFTQKTHLFRATHMRSKRAAMFSALYWPKMFMSGGGRSPWRFGEGTGHHYGASVSVLTMSCYWLLHSVSPHPPDWPVISRRTMRTDRSKNYWFCSRYQAWWIGTFSCSKKITRLRYQGVNHLREHDGLLNQSCFNRVLITRFHHDRS